MRYSLPTCLSFPKGICVFSLSTIGRIAAAVLLLAAPLPTHTQSSTYSPVVLNASPSSQDCPIGIYAERTAAGEIIQTSKSTSTLAPGQGLHISFDHKSAPTIAKATLTAHAYSTKLLLLPTNSDPSPDLTRTFHLRPNSSQPTLLTSDIWMQNAGSIGWLDLTEITYTNGTTWHPTTASTCRATPNGLSLIGSTTGTPR